MTSQEKRTLRIASIFVTAYLVLFGGYQLWRILERQRSEYRQLVLESQALRRKIALYDDRITVLKKLMEQFHQDPAKLKKSEVVANTSLAIQKAAQAGGLQVGTIRESSARTSGKELASIQFEGSGPVKGVLGFLQQLPLLGYPVIVDSTQISRDPTRPGQVKMNVTLLILDFERWKPEAPHA